MAIEVRYHVRIDVDEKRTKNSEHIDEKLGDLFYCDEINDMNVCIGNAACSPYIEFWCATLDLAKKYNEEVLSHLKKQRIYATAT